MKNLHLHIEGKVQGVGFRYTAKSVARSLGLSGFATNLTGGSVYMEVQGDESQLKEFINWCRRGPERAIVDKISVEESQIVDYPGFDTKF